MEGHDHQIMICLGRRNLGGHLGVERIIIIKGLVGEHGHLDALRFILGHMILVRPGNAHVGQRLLSAGAAIVSKIVDMVVFNRGDFYAVVRQCLSISSRCKEQKTIVALFRGDAVIFGQHAFKIDDGDIVLGKDILDVAENEVDIVVLALELLGKDGRTALHVAANGHIAHRRDGQQHAAVALQPRGCRRHRRGSHLLLRGLRPRRGKLRGRGGVAK